MTHILAVTFALLTPLAGVFAIIFLLSGLWWFFAIALAVTFFSFGSMILFGMASYPKDWEW